MSTKTPKQASAHMRTLLSAGVREVVRELPLAIVEMEGDIKQRIFRDGQGTGGDIGRYSTEPMYVSIKGAKKKYGSQIPTAKLKGRGKNSKKPKFKNGNERKSQYFERGYKGFRDYMGRPTDKVNLNLTGSLRGSIQSGYSGDTATIRIVNNEQGEIAASHEERYGQPIFTASVKEQKGFIKRLDNAAQRGVEQHK